MRTPPRLGVTVHVRSVVAQVTPIGDCTGLGLIRRATEDAARLAAAL